MAFPPWLRPWKSRTALLTPRQGTLRSRRPRHKRNAPAPTTRPCLEALEDRTVPAAVALPSGAVSWWAGDGSAADLVGSNAGTLNNGVTFFQGQVADGFRFNTANYVSAGTAGLPTGNANRTLEMWVKVNAFGPNEAYFAGYGNFGSGGQTYHLGTVSDHH